MLLKGRRRRRENKRIGKKRGADERDELSILFIVKEWTHTDRDNRKGIYVSDKTHADSFLSAAAVFIFVSCVCECVPYSSRSLMSRCNCLSTAQRSTLIETDRPERIESKAFFKPLFFLFILSLRCAALHCTAHNKFCDGL